MKSLSLATGVALTFAAPLSAQNWSSNAPVIGPVNQPEGVLIHPYPTHTNYCPSGLQPVTLGGVICCGTPNTTERFVNASTGHRGYRASSCPPGAKGCS